MKYYVYDDDDNQIIKMFLNGDKFHLVSSGDKFICIEILDKKQLVELKTGICELLERLEEKE